MKKNNKANTDSSYPDKGLDNFFKLVEEVKEEKRKTEEKRKADAAKEIYSFLFFSYDVVNSTKYKTICPEGVIIISEILDAIIAEIRNLALCHGPLFPVYEWKRMGDEVIFVAKINDTSNLPFIVSCFYKILQELWTTIKISSRYKEKFNELLSLKSTAWIITAVNRAGFPSKKGIRNIFYRYSDFGDFFGRRPYDDPFFYHNYDFMGPEMDTGFRIAEETSTRQLVISYELAYILLKEYKNSKKSSTKAVKKFGECSDAFDFEIHLRDFCTFKGVWFDEKYPVLYYFNKVALRTPDKKEKEAINVKDTFAQSDLVSRDCLDKKSKHTQEDINNSVFDILDCIREKERPCLDKTIKDIEKYAK